MKLTVLGKYGPFPKANGGTSSYLLECEGKNILLDAGEGSLSRLSAILKPEKLDAIVLTHSHYDHVCDIGVYNYYFEFLSKTGKEFKKPLLFFFDDGSPSLAPARTSPYFEKVEIADGFIYDLGGVSLSFTKVNHPALCHAVTVRSEKTFVYSGDTNLCPALEPLFSSADTFLAGGGFLFADWTKENPHLSVKHVSEFSKKFGNKSIISHLNPFYNEEDVKKEALLGGGNCVVAQEGETYLI